MTTIKKTRSHYFCRIKLECWIDFNEKKILQCKTRRWRREGEGGGLWVGKRHTIHFWRRVIRVKEKKSTYDTVYERPSLRFILTRPPCSISTFILCSFSWRAVMDCCRFLFADSSPDSSKSSLEPSWSSRILRRFPGRLILCCCCWYCGSTLLVSDAAASSATLCSASVTSCTKLEKLKDPANRPHIIDQL